MLDLAGRTTGPNWLKKILSKFDLLFKSGSFLLHGQRRALVLICNYVFV